MTRTFLVLVLAPALMATTCPQRVKVSLAPHTARAPAFVFSQRGAPLKTLNEFSVTQCRPEELQRPIWHVARSRAAAEPVLAWDEQTAGDSTEVLRITYGQTPEGFDEIVPPEPLVPGRCYLARVRDAVAVGGSEFRLASDGRMEMDRRGDAYLRELNELNRAAVHCRRSYRRASSADSARIDGHVHAVADTSVTCGELRTRHPRVMKGAVSRESSLLGAAVAAVGVVWLIWDGIDGDE